MNKKGQALVFFIIIIPVIILLFSLVIDYSNISREKKKLDFIASSSIKYLKDERNKEEVERIIRLNDKNINVIKLTKSEVILEKKVDAIFLDLVSNEYKIISKKN